MKKKKSALGRGLGALLSDQPASDMMAQSLSVPISKIRPNSFQPRTCFSKAELASLTASIKRDGVLTPVLLRLKSKDDDGYELIAGERRWRAAQAAGLPEIPAVVREVDDCQALELAIVENEQRDNLTAIESARAYQRLMHEFSYTQQKVAESIGISRVQVSNLVRLLQLPESVQRMVEQRQLDMGHARPLIGLPDAQAETLAKACIAHAWSARQMEREAKKKPDGSTRSSATMDADVAALQDELSRVLAMPVTLHCKPKGSGELRIHYGGLEELDGVLTRLRRRP